MGAPGCAGHRWAMCGRGRYTATHPRGRWAGAAGRRRTSIFSGFCRLSLCRTGRHCLYRLQTTVARWMTAYFLPTHNNRFLRLGPPSAAGWAAANERAPFRRVAGADQSAPELAAILKRACLTFLLMTFVALWRSNSTGDCE